MRRTIRRNGLRGRSATRIRSSRWRRTQTSAARASRDGRPASAWTMLGLSIAVAEGTRKCPVPCRDVAAWNGDKRAMIRGKPNLERSLRTTGPASRGPSLHQLFTARTAMARRCSAARSGRSFTAPNAMNPVPGRAHGEISAFVNLTSVVDPPTIIAFTSPRGRLMSGQRSAGRQLIAETVIPTGTDSRTS